MRPCFPGLILLIHCVIGTQSGFTQSNDHPLRQLPIGESTTDRESILSFMAELEKDIMRWRNRIEFVGDYVQRESGYGLSPEEAKAAVDISSEVARADNSKITARGKFAKQKLALRYQELAKTNLRYEHQPQGATVGGQFSVDLSAAASATPDSFSFSVACDLNVPSNADMSTGNAPIMSCISFV